MKKLAIIPARGGSKRIPRKNIRSFLGKPIISYSIGTALEAGLFDDLMVSTEDEEIAEIATSFGAKVPFYRSRENADDRATTAEVITEVLSVYSRQGIEYDYCCCIYPTAPFLTTETLKAAFDAMVENSFDTVFPVVKYDAPIQRALRIHDNRIEMFFPDFKQTRTQDLEPAYKDAGQFYWVDIARFRKHLQLWSDNTGYVIIPGMEAQDIDDETDWKLAEMKYRLTRQNTDKD